MGALDGRVAIITGAGRGQGRQHALLLAAEGARVVLNDSGVDTDGSHPDPSVVERVVKEIRAEGGEATGNSDSIADFATGERLVDAALAAFGDLHVVVNNAGILRFNPLPDMTEHDWDAVVDTHAKGAFALTRAAARYWRAQTGAGRAVRASVVNITSSVGVGTPLLGVMARTDPDAVLMRKTSLEEVNYAAAKAAVAQLTMVAASALEPYGVRVNAVAPLAFTRMVDAFDQPRAPEDPAEAHIAHPGNVSPLVAWLATEHCPATQMVFRAMEPGVVTLMDPWSLGEEVRKDFATGGRWTVAELDGPLRDLVAATRREERRWEAPAHIRAAEQAAGA